MTRCPSTPKQLRGATRLWKTHVRTHGADLRAFSLMELLIVIAVTVMLTSLLMPAMRQLHENAHRLMCSNNLSTLGKAFVLYSADNKDQLPESCTLREFNAPWDLMISRRNTPTVKWDGLGILFERQYCTTAECFYCPSHRGVHPYERYAAAWKNPEEPGPIFTNYHYSGDVTWNEPLLKIRRMSGGSNYVLATDGLRTAGDFNHLTGMNVLRADGSVRWREDTNGLYQLLPQGQPSGELQAVPVGTFETIWGTVESSQ